MAARPDVPTYRTDRHRYEARDSENRFGDREIIEEQLSHVSPQHAPTMPSPIRSRAVSIPGALAFLSRTLLSATFITAGADKLLRPKANLAYISSKKLPAPPVALGGAALTEIAVGLAVLLGWRPKASAATLAAYLVPTTLVFHNFWAEQGETREMQRLHFMKNLAIIGGLLGMAAHGTLSRSGEARA